MKKIAVASEGNNVSAHFGHCAEYTLYLADGGKIVKKTVVANPGHQPGFLPGFLAKMGVNCIIAGGMVRVLKIYLPEKTLKLSPAFPA